MGHLGGFRMIKRFWMLILISVLILLSGGAGGELSVMSSSIYKTAWRWGPGDTAEFEGNIIFDHISEDQPLILSLSAEASPEEAAVTSPVFRVVNGKKQSNRHPKSEIQIYTSDPAVRFSGGWELPENIRIDEAAIHLRVFNQNQELLCESELRMRNDQVVAGETGYHLPELSTFILYILISAAVVWLFAGVRIYLNRQRR